MKLNQNVKASISGIRGRYPVELNLANCLGLVESFIKSSDNLVKKIVVARDARLGSVEIYNNLLGLLKQLQIEVFDIGLSPLPTTGIAVKHFAADLGINVTASHNPDPWHGLKFLNSDGEFINQITLNKLLACYQDIDADYANIQSVDSDKFRGDALTHHLSLYPKLDLGYKIAVDCVNGAGSDHLPKLIEQLGCKSIDLACDPDRRPAREYEPNTDNLSWTTDQIKNLGDTVDLGIATDPDADRLVLLKPNGEVISEEYTLALAVWDMLLMNYQGPVVVNLSTSNLVQFIADKFKCELIRSAVGEQNVVQTMKENQAVIGGEGNGGVIDGKCHYSRDSLSAIYHVLNLMHQTDKTLNELIDQLPNFVIIKDKVTIKNNFKIDQIEELFINYQTIDKTDGLRIDFPDNSWIQVRRSNTEPIIRIYSEASTSDKANYLINQVKEFVLAR